MSMNEPRSIHAAEDWGVVLQSVPSKNKKGIVKHLGEIFLLDKHDAEQILSNMPLILVDNIPFGLAARIKKFFQTVGAVAETTNHDMIKKNCFQVLWPQTPDLSFFLKNETGPAKAPSQEKKSNPRAAEMSSFSVKVTSDENRPEIPPIQETPLPARPLHESSRVIPQYPSVSPKPAQESPVVVHRYPPIPEKPIQESPKIVSQPHAVSEEKPAVALPSSVDTDWERRAKELNEKLRKFHDEKRELHVQHVEATEKVKSELQRRIEEEKKKSDEIAKKAQEDLQMEAQKHEVLTREGEEWRFKAVALGEKVHELEMNLTQKISSVENLIQQKEDLARQSEKTASETQKELSDFRSREQEFSEKIGGLERSVQESAESLRARDSMLAQFEKQIADLAEKAQGLESLREEHAQLSKERATIRQEYDMKFAEQEVRLAKDEEDHRRYRSRMDRKNAAATRELGEWIRGIDTLRQGLQKLILFLGSESAVLDSERKSNLRSPLTRGPDSPNTGKS